MRELDIVVQNPTGLHARPAKVFVNIAKQFNSDIRVIHGERKANAKSMISMLTLGAERGSQIRIMIDGEDEEAAFLELKSAIESGLGEEPHADGPEPKAKDTPPEKTPSEPEVVQTPTLKEAGNLIKGIAAAPGIAIGPVFHLSRVEIVIDTSRGEPAEEEQRLQSAIEKARGQLGLLHNQMAASIAANEAAIFEVHMELLEDEELLEAVLAKIHAGQNAAQAWQSTIDRRAKDVASLNDPLLSARAADLHDVGYRVLRILVGAEEEQGFALPDHPVVVVARDLSPSDTASLDRTRVLGFCTAAGGPTSHTAIIARALSLPAVVGAGAAALELANQTTVIINGEEGTLTVDPSPELVRDAEESKRRWDELRKAAQETSAEPAVTKDGLRFEVVANIGGLADAEEALKMGAEGVGLLRTEFLFLDRVEPPTEREQFEVYRDIAQVMGKHPVIVRTLDIGGDKPLPYVNVPPEENPFLGERGIRLCLARPELFRQQLRAILRAAGHGYLRIMFPMVADVDEWRAARALVNELRSEMGSPSIEMGIMVEIPSAALVADAFAKEVDFFSIGTNDLTQYTLAMDRMHPTLAGKSDGLHPAVLRLIARTVQAAHEHGKWVGVCGELGSDPQAVPILIGLGVDELSVSVPAIPTVKALIRTLHTGVAQQFAQQVLGCATAEEVRSLRIKE